MAGEEKISLTQKELLEIQNPMWACFGQYGKKGCDLKCSKSTHLLCRKVTLFLSRGDP